MGNHQKFTIDLLSKVLYNMPRSKPDFVPAGADEVQENKGRHTMVTGSTITARAGTGFMVRGGDVQEAKRNADPGAVQEDSST